MLVGATRSSLAFWAISPRVFDFVLKVLSILLPHIWSFLMRKPEKVVHEFGYTYSLFVLSATDGMPVRGIFKNGALATFDLKNLRPLAEAVRKGCFGRFRKNSYLVQIEVWHYPEGGALDADQDEGRRYIVAAHFPLFKHEGTLWSTNPEIEDVMRILNKIRVRYRPGIGRSWVNAFALYSTCHSVFDYETLSLTDANQIKSEDLIVARERFIGLPYDRKTWVVHGFLGARDRSYPRREGDESLFETQDRG